MLSRWELKSWFVGIERRAEPGGLMRRRSCSQMGESYWSDRRLPLLPMTRPSRARACAWHYGK